MGYLIRAGCLRNIRHLLSRFVCIRDFSMMSLWIKQVKGYSQSAPLLAHNKVLLRSTLDSEGALTPPESKTSQPPPIEVGDFLDFVKWCIENDILKEFMQERGQEVLKAMTIDMTFERREELIRRDERAEGISEGIKQGLEQGIQQGIQQGKIEQLIELTREGLLEAAGAAQKAGMTETEFEKFL